MGSFSSYELFIIPSLDVLFIIPDFLTPNIHYSFSFKPRYSLFSFHLRNGIIVRMLNVESQL